MNKLHAAIMVLAVSTAQADDIIVHDSVYYIDEFIQFNGTNTFIDSFSDGEEPPAGPLSGFDYIVAGSFGIDRENGETELLELNSSDSAIGEAAGELVCAVGSRSFFFSAGSGGSLTGVFELNDGLFANSYFGLGIDNFQTPDLPFGEPTESATVGVGVDRDGFVFAVWGQCIDGTCDEPELDITSALGANTCITLEITISSSDVMTAKWDYGSDGIFELTRCKFATLNFTAGTYTGRFEVLVGCSGDIDGDGTVGITDFLDLLAAWGPNPRHPADLDFDGTVGILDFLILLANWGACP